MASYTEHIPKAFDLKIAADHEREERKKMEDVTKIQKIIQKIKAAMLKDKDEINIYYYDLPIAFVEFQRSLESQGYSVDFIIDKGSNLSTKYWVVSW